MTFFDFLNIFKVLIHKIGCVLGYPKRSVFYKVVGNIYGAKSAVMQILASKFSKTLDGEIGTFIVKKVN